METTENMKRSRSSIRGGVLLIAAVLGLASLAAPLAAEEPGPATRPLPGRVFASSRKSIDEVLTRPYDREVPMGCVGDRVWASSPQGWAFRDDVHWLYLTNLKAFDLDIRDEQGRLVPDRATYYPSHIHYEGAARKAMTASASFTFATDNVENPLTEPFEPRKRWTCWSSGRREDSYTIEFGSTRTLSGFEVYFFDDAPNGECRPPAAFEVQRGMDERVGPDGRLVPRFVPVELTNTDPARPKPGKNEVRFRPIRSSRFRLFFHHAGRRFYTGLYGLRPIYQDRAEASPPPSPLQFTADKFITSDDILVSVVRVHNPTDRMQTIRVEPVIQPRTVFEHQAIGSVSGLIELEGREVERREPRGLSLTGHQELHVVPVSFRFRYAVLDDPPRTLKVAFDRSARGAPFLGFAGPSTEDPGADFDRYGHHIQPGRTKVFKAALALRTADEPSNLDSVLKRTTYHNWIIRPDDQDNRDIVTAQVKVAQAWYDANVPYFDCSDPWVRKMYDHRAYVLRKNMLDPKLGSMKSPTQAEGRWRSTWYPNVISYGAGHQIREARWLRDPKYWEGHLRTWAWNEKPDGVYPSHVTLKGPSDGQYTDWITSTAWEGHLVHPDRAFLASVVGSLAANVRGWQRVYDPDGDGLLLVDSHWWTGMEYQPSFFFFSEYKPSKDFQQPARPVSLERVDLTAYNYGNAVAVARMYRLLGRPEQAKEFEDLANKIGSAVANMMWRPEKRFFYSLRAEDDAVADVKEVIGVYPFYFGMLPWGKGYESAWASILDPKQFWTTWPVASASKECPAYSQTNWPGDGRAAGCMWNGPTWPHANSLVMTAMARTLRATRDHHVADSPLRKEHLWDLFLSFTKAQYRNQDLRQPWTGEFYNGDTGKWKTAERDYNHSTWLDILIPELIGLVPREDETLEVDPLLSEGALGHFILDGVRYHGHDVTVVWDAPAPHSPDQYADGRKGLDVYVDGRLVASAAGLSRLQVELAR
jgi:hypothetical protein